jgi:hypothetical protein
MEKRIAGIIRWLERCLEAQRAGELESALMDVECARADMDLLRDGVWSKLDRRRAARRRRAFVLALFKTALGAAVILLAAATPLSFPLGKLDKLEKKARQETIAALEPAILDETKTTPPAELREIPIGRENLQAEFLPSSAGPARTAVSAISVNPKRTEARSTPDRQDERNEMNLSYENILALVQMGEKALKNEKPAIQIER